MRRLVFEYGESMESMTERLTALLKKNDESSGKQHPSNNAINPNPTEIVLNSVDWNARLWKLLDRTIASTRPSHPINSVTITNSTIRSSCQGWAHHTQQFHFSRVQLPTTIDFPLKKSRLTSLTLNGSTLVPGVATSLSCYLLSPDCLLETLDLTGAYIGDTVASILAVPGLSFNTSLLTLCLSECNLSDKQATALLQALAVPALVAETDTTDHSRTPTKHGKKLRELDLSFNKCEFDSILALARLLEPLPLGDNEHDMSLPVPLTKVSIGFQAFGHHRGIHLTSVLKTLLCNQHLQELELGGNGLVDDDLVTFIMRMALEDRFHTTLVRLDLSANKLTNRGIARLAENLHRFPRLRCLSLEDLRLVKSHGWKKLAQSIVQFSEKKRLELEEVEITDSKFLGSQAYRNMAYHLDQNWGGRGRLHAHDTPITQSLWPYVWARANNPERYGMTSRTPSAPDIIFAYLVDHVPVLLG